MMLASVRSLDEALIALEGGADLIDLKEPSRGALGALDHAAVRICTQAIGGRRPVSATIGDIPSMDPPSMAVAVKRIAGTGVDFIKIGFFAHRQAIDCARALAEMARDTRLVAVIFADEPWNLKPVAPGRGNDLIDLTDALARAGFAGAMLDTAHKTGKRLRDWRDMDELGQFIDRVRGLGLLSGLAGSLHQEDIATLLELAPDYLGFRGALCADGDRKQTIDNHALSHVRALIPARARTFSSRAPLSLQAPVVP
jgi:uncharacterized protein (UPF0264 family)